MENMSTTNNRSNMKNKKLTGKHQTKMRSSAVPHAKKYKYSTKSTWVSMRPSNGNDDTPASSSRSTTNHGTKGSLKSQLRGQQRLLDKFISTTPTDEQSSEEFLHRKQTLEAKIKSLELQNRQNRLKEIERRNAIRYHKVKFFERQKLTRMERKLTRKLKVELSSSPNDDVLVQGIKDELDQVHQDQLYVKFYPNDTKYVSLFPDGVYYKASESTESEEVKAKRAEIRKRISEIVKEDPQEKQQLDNIDGATTTSIEQILPKKKTKDDKSRLKKKNYGMQGMKTSLATGTTGAQDREFPKNTSVSGIDARLVDTDDVDKLPSHMAVDAEDDENASNVSESDSIVSSSSSSSSTSTSGSSTSTSTNESSVVEKPNVSVNNNTMASDESEEDDFFAETEVNVNTLFQDANIYSEGVGSARGDKSKGWATQKQRPGKFKPRIERRRL
jgi:hypothetical protein